jgi:hypothetical protein
MGPPGNYFGEGWLFTKRRKETDALDLPKDQKSHLQINYKIFQFSKWKFSYLWVLSKASVNIRNTGFS